MKKVLFLFCSVLAIASCSSSNVYDPSLTLPSSPLSSRQMQATGTLGAFPHTRPQAEGAIVSAGASGTVRFAPTSWLTLQGRGWIANLTGDNTLSGLSVSALIRLDNKNDGLRWVVVPTYGWSFSGNIVEGRGTSLILGAWLPQLDQVQPYVGIGGAYGWHPSNSGTYEGWGAIANTGMHYRITQEFSILAELTTVVQINRFDNVTHVIASPVFGLSYQW